MRKIHCFTLSFLLINGTLYSQGTVIDSLKVVLANEKDDTSRVLTLAAIGFEFTNKQAETALDYAGQSLQLAQRSEFRRGEAIATRTFARCLSTLGNFPKSLELSVKSLRMFEEMKDEAEVARTNGFLSDIYRDAGDYETALRYSLRANDFFRQSNDMATNSYLGSTRKITLAVTASIYERIGKFDSALQYAQKAYDLDIKETGGKFGWLNLQLGKIHAGLKHTEVALAYYHSALPLIVENNTSKDLLEAYNSIARLFGSLGKYDSSIYYAREGLSQGSPSAYEKGILESLTILSENFKALKWWDSTLTYLEKSVSLRDRMYGQQQVREIQNISFLEDLRQQELAHAKERAEKERRSGLQMLAIGIFITVFISGVVVLSRKRPAKIVRFLGVVGLLLAFEFVTLFTHPWIEEKTDHTPIYSLLLLVLIASVLVPLHHYFENLLRRSGPSASKGDQDDVLV